MGEQLAVSLPDLQQASNRLRDVATGFRTSWTTFAAKVDAYGDIFGNDDLGKLIGLSYQAAHLLPDNPRMSNSRQSQGAPLWDKQRMRQLAREAPGNTSRLRNSGIARR